MILQWLLGFEWGRIDNYRYLYLGVDIPFLNYKEGAWTRIDSSQESLYYMGGRIIINE